MAEKKGFVWRLGEIMVQQGYIKWNELEEALAIQRKTGYMMGDILVNRGHMPPSQGSILHLGEILVRKGWVSWDHLESALAEQRETGKMLGEVLLEKGFITTERLYQALAIQHNLPFVKIHEIQVPSQALQKVPKKYAEEFRIMPVLDKDNILVIALADPAQVWPEDEISKSLPDTYKIKHALAQPDDIQKAIQKYYGS